MRSERRFVHASLTVLAALALARMATAAASPAPVPAEAGTPDTVRAAIQHLARTSEGRYPRAAEYLDRLEALKPGLAATNPAVRDAAQAEFITLRHAALASNPLVCGAPILFTVRPQYWGTHGPINTTFENGEIQAAGFRGGSALKRLQLDAEGRVARIDTLLDAPEGVIRDPEVRFDARRVAFALRRNKADDYHICELDLETGILRQRTFGPMSADVEPLYLPDGRILFQSLRDLKYCQCNRHSSGNLFVMDDDGANLIQIGGNNLWEGHASVHPDGRILYSRWEYVDRQFGPSFGLWTCNPDGTSHVLYYGNNAWVPGKILDASVIPGTDQVLCIFGACHDLTWGAMALIDRRLGLDGSAPVLRLWPESTRAWLANADNVAWRPGDIDAFGATRPKYEDPYPLSDSFYLVTRTLLDDPRLPGYFVVDGGNAGHLDRAYSDAALPHMRMGIFLADRFGNEILLHAEGPGCFDARPLVARARPPVIPLRVNYAETTGVFYVSDIYRGTGMDKVPRGTIRWMRVIEAPPKRAWSSQGGGGIDADQAPLMNWNLTNNKRVLGDVPVEPDGSACFRVPANTFIYFQALDADKLMVQSMRSGTFLQPGEVQGCTGCHEPRLGAPPDYAPPTRPGMAHDLAPWYGPPREFNYLTEVQPVFDRHCLKCHDYGGEGAKKLLLAGDVGLLFNASYLDLNRRSAERWFPDRGPEKLLVKAVHDGPPAVLPPYAWGAHRSKLVDVIRGDHHGVKLNQ